MVTVVFLQTQGVDKRGILRKPKFAVNLYTAQYGQYVTVKTLLY